MAHQSHADQKRGALIRNRTPAPDEVLNVRSPTKEGFGQNGGQNGPAQSVRPGGRIISPLGLNLEDTVGDDVLANVIAHGTGRNSSDFGMFPQTRDPSVLGPAVPFHPSMQRNQDPSILARKTELPQKPDFASGNGGDYGGRRHAGLSGNPGKLPSRR